MIKQTTKPQALVVRGNVIEIFEDCGKTVARISVEPFYLNIPSDGVQDAHLGDRVTLNGKLNIEHMQIDFNSRNGNLEL